MQEQEAHYENGHRKRFALAISMFLLLIGGGVFWIMNKDKGFWSSIFVIVFTVLGVVFALFQWLLPTSTEKNKVNETSGKERRNGYEEIVDIPVAVEIEGIL